LINICLEQYAGHLISSFYIFKLSNNFMHYKKNMIENLSIEDIMNEEIIQEISKEIIDNKIDKLNNLITKLNELKITQ